MTADPTTQLEFAMALAPNDRDVCAVYADSLGGDPLGEFISLHCRIPDATTDRRRLVGAANALWREHAATWLARWNTPQRVFPKSPDLFCGLPTTAQIAVLDDPPALDGQLARLPIERLAISGLEMPSIATLGELPVFGRVSSMVIDGDRRETLGGSLVPWLAHAHAPRLEELFLSFIRTPGDQARALVDGLPALRRLSLFGCDITVDAIERLAASAAADRLERLTLSYNAIGAAALPAIAKLAKLRDLSLANCEIGDDVVVVTDLPVEIFQAGSWEDRGPLGFAALIHAMPKLTALEAEGLAPHHVAALAPIAERLVRLELGDLALETASVIVTTLLGRASALETLAVGDAMHLAGAIVAHTALRELTLHGLTDDDVLAIARSPNATRLVNLHIAGTFSDETIVRLVESPHLQQLRRLSIESPQLAMRATTALFTLPNLESLTLDRPTISDERPFLRPADMNLTLYFPKVDPDKLARIEAHWGNLLYLVAMR